MYYCIVVFNISAARMRIETLTPRPNHRWSPNMHLEANASGACFKKQSPSGYDKDSVDIMHG